MKRTNKNRVSRFRNEDQDRELRSKCDSTDYVDRNKAKKVTRRNPKPSLKEIRVRLPIMMLEQLKSLATQKDVPYRLLVELFLSERIAMEFGRSAKHD